MTFTWAETHRIPLTSVTPSITRAELSIGRGIKLGGDRRAVVRPTPMGRGVGSPEWGQPQQLPPPPPSDPEALTLQMGRSRESRAGHRGSSRFSRFFITLLPNGLQNHRRRSFAGEVTQKGWAPGAEVSESKLTLFTSLGFFFLCVYENVT